MKAFVGIVILLAVLLPSWAEAVTVNAATCSYADVNTAVTAAITGDTVQIPGGTCTWTAQLVFTNRSITIQGVGAGTEAQCAVPGQTTYTCLNRTNSLLNWTTVGSGNPSGLSVLKNLTVDTSGAAGGSVCSSAAGQGTYNVAALNFAGLSDSVRVTGLRIVYGNGCGGIRFGRAYGVVDHTDFVAHNQLTHGMLAVRTASQTADLHGDESWSTASTMGGNKNVFVEDSTFTADQAVINAGGAYFTDHFLGGRVVMRFNTVTGGSFQQHGTESGGRDRSNRHVEYYRNLFVWSGALTQTQMAIRGATGKLWDNTATGSILALGQMNTDRAGSLPAQPGYYPWAYCLKSTATSITQSGTTATVTVPQLSWSGGISTAQGISNDSYLTVSGADQSAYNGTFVVHKTSSTVFTYTMASAPGVNATGTISVYSPFDGNTDATGYPCLDQTGRGNGTQLMTGEGPNDGNTMNPSAWLHNQVLDPVYCWNNLISASLSACTIANGGDVIVSLRDYYNQHAAFDGVTNHGIGRGARGSRPASATDGDAYFATNDSTNWNLSTTETYSANIAGLSSGADGCLDVRVSGAWVNCFYTPYTYPHPLNYGYVAPTPSNPTGVRVVGTTTATSATLVWTPSTNSDFKSYKVYHGLASGSYTLPVTTITVASSLAAHKPLAQHTFQSPLAGTHYFVVTEVNTQDLESPVSSEVSIALTGLLRTAAPLRSPRP